MEYSQEEQKPGAPVSAPFLQLLPRVSEGGHASEGSHAVHGDDDSGKGGRRVARQDVQAALHEAAQ